MFVMKAKAQVTVEFIIVMALTSMIFLVIINFIAQERKSSAQGMWAQDAQDTAERLARAIDAAYLAGSGSSMNVTLPMRLVGGMNYTVTVRERLVSVSVPGYGRDFEWKYANAGVEGARNGLALGGGVIVLTNRNGTVNLTSY
jgi:hypothetical protein